MKLPSELNHCLPNFIAQKYCTEYPKFMVDFILWLMNNLFIYLSITDSKCRNEVICEWKYEQLNQHENKALTGCNISMDIISIYDKNIHRKYTAINDVFNNDYVKIMYTFFVPKHQLKGFLKTTLPSTLNTITSWFHPEMTEKIPSEVGNPIS